MPAPRGEGYIKGRYLKFQMVLYGLLVFQLPLISPLCGQQAAEIAFGRQLGEKSPPRGSLDERKGFPFLLNFAVSKMKQGEGYIKGINFTFKQFATVRYEKPCGCVTKRAMHAPGKKGYFKG